MVSASPNHSFRFLLCQFCQSTIPFTGCSIMHWWSMLRMCEVCCDAWWNFVLFHGLMSTVSDCDDGFGSCLYRSFSNTNTLYTSAICLCMADIWNARDPCCRHWNETWKELEYYDLSAQARLLKNARINAKLLYFFWAMAASGWIKWGRAMIRCIYCECFTMTTATTINDFVGWLITVIGIFPLNALLDFIAFST